MTNHTLNACCYSDVGEKSARALKASHVKSLGFMANRASFIEWCRHAQAVYRQRRELLQLTNHQLEDIGLTRQQVRNEANRPFWDFP